MPPIWAVRSMSCLSSFQFRQPVPQLHQCPLGFTHFLQPASCRVKISLRSSAALRRCFAKLGGNEAFVFEPLQSGIHTADGYIATSPLLKLFAYGNAICVVAEPHEREHHHQFKT